MPRRKTTDQDPEIPLYLGMTPNQVVAFNLAQARAWKRWTQDEAAEALAPYLGSRWSKANFSAAERSFDGTRIRNFDADEIVAFAQAFELPVTFFFMPPPPWAHPGIPVLLEQAGREKSRRAISILVDLVFGEAHNQGLLSLRLESFMDAVGDDFVTEAQASIETLVKTRLAKLAKRAIRQIDNWKTWLRATANQLEDLETRARYASREELDLDEDYLPEPPRFDDGDGVDTNLNEPQG